MEELFASDGSKVLVSEKDLEVVQQVLIVITVVGLRFDFWYFLKISKASEVFMAYPLHSIVGNSQRIRYKEHWIPFSI